MNYKELYTRISGIDAWAQNVAIEAALARGASSVGVHRIRTAGFHNARRKFWDFLQELEEGLDAQIWRAPEAQEMAHRIMLSIRIDADAAFRLQQPEAVNSYLEVLKSTEESLAATVSFGVVHVDVDPDLTEEQEQAQPEEPMESVLDKVAVAIGNVMGTTTPVRVYQMRRGTRDNVTPEPEPVPTPEPTWDQAPPPVLDGTVTADDPRLGAALRAVKRRREDVDRWQAAGVEVPDHLVRELSEAEALVQGIHGGGPSDIDMETRVQLIHKLRGLAHGWSTAQGLLRVAPLQHRWKMLRAKAWLQDLPEDVKARVPVAHAIQAIENSFSYGDGVHQTLSVAARQVTAEGAIENVRRKIIGEYCHVRDMAWLVVAASSRVWLHDPSNQSWYEEESTKPSFEAQPQPEMTPQAAEPAADRCTDNNPCDGRRTDDLMVIRHDEDDAEGTASLYMIPKDEDEDSEFVTIIRFCPHCGRKIG